MEAGIRIVHEVYAEHLVDQIDDEGIIIFVSGERVVCEPPSNKETCQGYRDALIDSVVAMNADQTHGLLSFAHGHGEGPKALRTALARPGRTKMTLKQRLMKSVEKTNVKRSVHEESR